MKTIGMIGGMSWESSLEYYRLINEGVKSRLGGLHSAECLMYSVDFEPIERLQHAGDWSEQTRILIDIAQRLEGAGAELLMICTNTMHKMADEVQESTDVPLLHIADAAAYDIRRQGMKHVGLLGTRFTMEQDFYKGRLADKHDIDVIVPESEDMDVIHNIIYNELCLGELKPESKAQYIKIIEKLAAAGAEGVVLGCTEIPLLIKPEDSPIPVFNTTELHAAEAVRAAVGTESGI